MGLGSRTIQGMSIKNVSSVQFPSQYSNQTWKINMAPQKNFAKNFEYDIIALSFSFYF